MSTRSPLATLAAALGLALAAGAGASESQAQVAQPQPGPRAPPPAIDEIVVTAQKREQLLQDVPISITAFDAAAIESSQIRSLEDYAPFTPNLVVQGLGNPGSSLVGIRGITNLVEGVSNSFGIYLDEFNLTPSSVSTTYDPDLLDVQRIEVLRGPQGTHFGRNTTAGAINLTTIKPDLEARSGRAEIDYGSFGTGLVRLSVNTPISDELAVRGTGYWWGSRGFLRDSGPADNDPDPDRYGGRLALRWEPSPLATLDLQVLHSEADQGLNTTVSSGELTGTFTNPVLGQLSLEELINLLAPTSGWPTVPVDEVGFYPSNTDRVSLDRRVDIENETTLAMARLEVDFEAFRLTALGGWIDNDFDRLLDGDNTSFSIVNQDSTSRLSAFSGELRLTAHQPVNLPWGDLLWTAGVFFGKDEVADVGKLTYLADNPYDRGLLGVFLDPGLLFEFNFENDTRSAALFGELAWSLTDRLELIAGARYTHDDIRFTGFADGQEAFIAVVPEDDDRSHWNDVSPRLVGIYRWRDDVRLYASVSKGYKAGGFSVTTEPSQRVFDEEKAWSYEIGAKTELLDRRVRANLAAFYVDWRDFQVASFDPVTAAELIQNAERARSIGFELELAARPYPGVDVTAGVGYVDAEFRDFPDALNFVTAELEDAAGNDIPLAPSWTIGATAQYSFPLPFAEGLEGFVRAEYSFVDDQFGDASNNDLLAVSDYDLLNFRIGITTPRTSVVGYVENVRDEVYYRGVFPQALSFTGTQRAVGWPRTFGLRIAYRWD